MKPIQLALISDDNYVVPTSVALKSIIASKAPGRELGIHIIASGLSSDSKRAFLELESKEVKITLIERDPTVFKELHTFKEDAVCVASISALFKFVLPQLLPDHDKVLYLDGDLIVKRDLGEIYDLELGENYAAVVPDSGQIYYKHDYVRRVKKYFNSGVMLLNLKEMRKHHLAEVLVRTKKELTDSNLMDQNVFNVVFDGHLKYLPIKWNFMPVSLDRAAGKWKLSDINELFEVDYKNVRDLFDDAAIIHYSSKDKPWKSPDGALAYEWTLTRETPELKSVSVIIPTFNVENYIEESLKSVLAQDIPELEVICLDDGSTDKTKKHIKAMMKTDKRIKLIENTNHRQGFERNRGLEMAKGEYAYFMDSDDLLLPGALKRLVSIAEADKLDLMYFEGDSFYETKELEKAFPRFKSVYHRKDAFPKVYSGVELYGLLRKSGDLIISPCLQLARRKWLVESGVRFPEDMLLMEDNLYTVKSLLKASRVRVLTSRHFSRRVRKSSTMTGEKRGQKELAAIEQIVAALLKLSEEEKEAKYWLYHHAAAFLRTAKVVPGHFDGRLMNKLPYLESQLAKASEPNTKLTRFQRLKACLRDNGLKYTILLAFEKRPRFPIEKVARYLAEVKFFRFLICLAYTLYSRPKAILSSLFAFKVKKGPLVSVVIPVGCFDKVHEKMMKSLRAQTYQNIEIIEVDDTAHEGAGNARNKGLKKARGKYVIFLDADDFFEKRFIATLVKKAEAEDLDLVMCYSDRYEQNWKLYSPMEWKWVQDPFLVPTVFVRLFSRELLVKSGLKFQNLPRNNDIFFSLAASSLARRREVLPKTLVHYRNGQKTNLQSGNYESPTCCIEALEAVKSYLSEAEFEIVKARTLKHNIAVLRGVERIELIKKVREPRVMVLPVKTSIGGGNTYIRQKLAEWGAKKTSENPDLIHINHFRSLFKFVFTPFKPKKVPVVFVVHGIHLRKFDFLPKTALNRFRRWLRFSTEKYLYSKIDELIVLNKADEKMLKEEYKVKCRVLLQPNTIPPIPIPPTLIPPTHFLLMLARFDFPKGQDILLKAISETQDKLRELNRKTLLIGGRGRALHNMIAKAKKLGISDLVDFGSLVKDGENELWRGEVLVAPSRWEGSPFTVLEARVRGKKIIASDCAGNVEALEGYDKAMFFKTADVDDLASLLTGNL